MSRITPELLLLFLCRVSVEGLAGREGRQYLLINRSAWEPMIENSITGEAIECSGKTIGSYSEGHTIWNKTINVKGDYVLYWNSQMYSFRAKRNMQRKKKGPFICSMNTDSKWTWHAYKHLNEDSLAELLSFSVNTVKHSWEIVCERNAKHGPDSLSRSKSCMKVWTRWFDVDVLFHECIIKTK